MQPKLLHRGKVRDVYQWDSDLLLVASDRISAFDVILPTTIPGKGILLTQLSKFWFDFFTPSIAHHIISFELPPQLDRPEWRHRTTWCKRAQVIPMECVVRGYLFGSAWKEYKRTGSVQGFSLPQGLQEAAALPEILFTPSTKASEGHDQPLTQTQAQTLVGKNVYAQLRDLSLAIYRKAHQYALERGVIISDTKFEFAWLDGKMILVDELLTPDSSRFWPAESYLPGKDPSGFDKQVVRDYLLSLKDWNHQAPGPQLPAAIVAQVQEKYAQVYLRLTGKAFSLK